MQNDNYLFISKKDESNEPKIHPEIASSTTAKVNVLLLNISEISDTVFDIDKSKGFYENYPTIKAKVDECMSKEKEIRFYDLEDEEKIETLIALNFDFDGMKKEGLGIIGSERLNQFDKNVLDAITTLHIEGHNKYISANMIHHVLTGRRKKTSTNYVDEINNSINKLMFTHIITKTNEDDELMDFRLLPATRTRAKLNGYEVPCIRIDGNLPLYMHAGFRKKVLKLELSLLNMPFVQNKNENKVRMDILYYLLRRIITINRLNKRVKYETIYHELGYDNAHRQIKFDIRNRIKAILDSWKGLNLGDINFIDYEENKKGRIPYEIIINYRTIKGQNSEYEYDYGEDF